MEVHQLRYAVAVADTLNFGAAARRLNVSQPPITRAIQSLEAELGLTLFERDHRHVALTDAGHRFITDARDILDRLDASARRARAAADGEEGRLILGFEGSTASDLIPRAVRAHRDRYPQIVFELREMPTHDALEAMTRRAIDAAFVLQPFDHPAIRSDRLSEEPLSVALAADHPLTTAREIAIESLRTENLITSLQLNRCGIFDRLMAACLLAGFTPSIVAEVNEAQLMLGFIASGLGVSVVARSVTRLAYPGVVFRPLAGPMIPTLSLALAWPAGETTGLIALFRHTARATAGLPESPDS